MELKRNLSQKQQALFDTETLGKFLHANNNSLEETLKNLKDFVAWHDELDQDVHNLVNEEHPHPRGNSRIEAVLSTWHQRCG